jgi:hypothetical protein
VDAGLDLGRKGFVMARKWFPYLLLLSAACGGDSKQTASDAGARDGGDEVVDAAVQVIPGRITSVGEACTKASDCTGAKPECIQDLAFPGGYFTAAFPDGYCSAACTQDSECSDNGESGRCPLGQLAQLNAAGLAQITSFIQPLSTCLKLCTDTADCRTPGYQCRSASDALSAVLPEEYAGLVGIAAGILPRDTYCFPEDIEIPALEADGGGYGDGDGGSDGGSDDAGSDAGAAEPDAGTSSDAGGDEPDASL